MSDETREDDIDGTDTPEPVADRAPERDGAADSAPEPAPFTPNTSTDPRQRLFVPLLALSAVALLLLGAVGGALWGMNNPRVTSAEPTASPSASPTGDTPTASPSATPTDETPKPDIAVPKGSAGWGEPIIEGSVDAPVSVSLVEDMTCPFCAMFHEDNLAATEQAVASGQANIKHYVVAFFGEGAFAGAEAVSCAADQDALTPYSTILYKNQKPDHEGFTEAEFIKFAKDPASGITDIPAFTECLQSHIYLDYVNSINSVAEAAGVPGTPAVYVDQQMLDLGSLTPQLFADILNGASIDNIGPKPLG